MEAPRRHTLKPPVSAEDWTRGPAEARVTLVEYLDFQCPCCHGSFPAVERVLEELGDRVRYVVREFPIPSAHPHAEGAARAAEAAGRQGRFWEMYRLLLELRGRVGPPELESCARELDLDLARFHADVAGDEVQARIRESKHWGLRSGVNGTPTLFVNGVRYEEAACPVQAAELQAALLAAGG